MRIPVPSDLTAVVGHEQVELRWMTNRGGAVIQGYNIYIDESPVVGPDGAVVLPDEETFHDEVYPGDLDPATEFETFEARGLRDGVRYYAAVTIVMASGIEGPPSNMIDFVCHPHGEISLGTSFSGEREGFSFERAEFVNTDAAANQIYFTQIDGKDYLASPGRIDDILQTVRFYPLSINSIRDRFEPPSGSGSDKIRVVEGGSYLLRTSDNKHAKIIVTGFSGSGDDRMIRFVYSYMPMPGYTDF